MAKTDLEFTALESTYWSWVDRECPFPQGSRKRATWMKSNRFVFDGIEFTRMSVPLKSSSGKSIVAWRTTFSGVRHQNKWDG